MRLDLGSPVECSDAKVGELADVVIDPTTRRVTHLVVEPHHRHDQAQLVPVELARGDDGDAIRLGCTQTEFAELPRIAEIEYLRLGEFPVEDPRWDVGIGEMLALPYYDAVDMPANVIVDYEQHVTVTYDRVPKGEVEIRRASSVNSSDGHFLGHVDGFVVDGEQHVGHIVLEHGHLWGKREVAIPIGAVARVENDAVYLSLSKDDVEALEPMPVHRWLRHRRG
jgi:sporulation protein YlmC with PRC-barrel domain